LLVENDIVETTIREHGSDSWGNTLDLAHGNLVQVKIVFNNISDYNLDDVLLRAEFEDGIEFVSNTLCVTNKTSNAKPLAGNPSWDGGVSIGSYASGETAIIDYYAVIRVC
jgi:hypothetical protein